VTHVRHLYLTQINHTSLNKFILAIILLVALLQINITFAEELTDSYYYALQQKLTVCHCTRDGYVQIVMGGNDSAYPYRVAQYYYLNDPSVYRKGLTAAGSYKKLFSKYDIVPPNDYNSGYDPNIPPEQQNISFGYGEYNWNEQGQMIWKNNCNHHSRIKI